MKFTIQNENSHSSEHWDGVQYGKISIPQFEINNIFLNEFSFFGNEDVLDIGCGNGATTKLIADKVTQGNVLGIDSSKSMIMAANSLNSHGNVRFNLLNAQSISFKSQFNIGSVDNSTMLVKKP